MTFIPTPNGLKWAMNFGLQTRPVAITGHVYTPDPTVLAQRQQLSANLFTWWTNAAGLNTQLSIQIQLQTIVVTDVSSAAGGVWIDVVPQPANGAINSESVPANSCLVTTLQTNSRGRSYRGRIYMPGCPDALRNNTTTWSTGYVNAMQTIMASLFTYINQGGQYLAIQSLHTNKVARPTGVLTQCASVRVNARIGSQRRRTGGF